MGLVGRRQFLILTGVLCATAQFALAQSAGTVRRIAILEYGDKNARVRVWSAFQERLRELGYREGRNLVVERRWADGIQDRLPELARELVSAQPEVIVAESTPATRAAAQATRTIPIVFPFAGDPVGAGLVASLARPGGNVTGFSFFASDTAGKRIQLLQEVAPDAKRIGLLGPAGNRGIQAMFRQLQKLAPARNAVVRLLDAKDPATIQREFDRLAVDPVDALIVGAIHVPNRVQIADLAVRYKIPAIYFFRDHIESGGLISYGPDLDAQYRRVAEYVHRLLQGAKPADLPVEQPTKLWLGVNLKAARAIGRTVPQSLLLLADEVLE